MISAIVVTHGNLGEELLQTAVSIVGDIKGCFAVSNSNKSPQVLCEELASIIADGERGGHFIVFVDFFGGSCCHACLTVQQEHPETRIIAGVNLPMILAFLNKRGEVEFDKLPEMLAARGQSSIQVIDSSCL